MSRKSHLISLNQAIMGYSLTEMEMTNYQAIYVRCVGACWCDICKVGKLAFITVSHMHSTIQHDVFTPCKKKQENKFVIPLLRSPAKQDFYKNKTNLLFNYSIVRPNKIFIKKTSKKRSQSMKQDTVSMLTRDKTNNSSTKNKKCTA